VYQAQQSQMMQNYPFLQWLLGGGQGGNFARNPFLNIYQPLTAPGSSATTGYPTPPAGPGNPPPPIMPPPTSATIYPGQTAAGASPIGQIPPAPLGAVPAGGGSAGVPGAAGAGDINPAAVPPFQSTVPSGPTPLTGATMGGTAQMPQAAGTASWVYRNGQFVNPATGNTGQPGPTDIVQLSGGGPGPNGSGIPYSQFISQGYAGTAGAFQAAQMAANQGAAQASPGTYGPPGIGPTAGTTMGGTLGPGGIERGYGSIGPGDIQPGGPSGEGFGGGYTGAERNI
jgi:hypothetical protein